MSKSKDEGTKSSSKTRVIMVSPINDGTKSNSTIVKSICEKSDSQIILNSAKTSSKDQEDCSRTDSIIAIDRKFSVLEWIVLLSAPIINPLIGIAMIIFGVRYLRQKSSCDRDQALRSKAMILGLAQWAYRLSVTVAIFVLVLMGLYKLDRFPGL